MAQAWTSKYNGGFAASYCAFTTKGSSRVLRDDEPNKILRDLTHNTVTSAGACAKYTPDPHQVNPDSARSKMVKLNQGAREKLMEDLGSIFLRWEDGVDLPTYVIRHTSKKGNIANSILATSLIQSGRHRRRTLFTHHPVPILSTHNGWQDLSRQSPW